MSKITGQTAWLLRRLRAFKVQADFDRLFLYIPLHCATKSVVAGFSPRSLSSKRTILSSRRTVVYLHPTNASRHQRKSLCRRPARSSSQRKRDEKWRFRRRPSFSWFYGTPISTIGVPLSITRIHFGTASMLSGTAPKLFGTASKLFGTASKLFGTASKLFGSAPLNADLGGEPGGARHALQRSLKLVKTWSPLLVVISLPSSAGPGKVVEADFRRIPFLWPASLQQSLRPYVRDSDFTFG